MSIRTRFASVGARTGLVAAIVLATTVGAVAFAHETRGHAWHHEMSAGMSAEDISAHVEEIMKHVYVEIDATDAQKAELDPMVKQALTDLAPLHHDAHEFHAQALALLSADRIDRAQLEAMRAQHVAAIDIASRRLTQLIGDVADVLTPAQRKKLADHIAAHHGHG